MPKYPVHAFLGVASGAAYSVAVQAQRSPQGGADFDPVHTGVCAFAGYLGGCLPDKLEPADRATGPNHRGALHSVWLLVFALRGAYRLANMNVENDFQRWAADIAGAFCAGVSSHLLADLTTARGLNFVCKEF